MPLSWDPEVSRLHAELEFKAGEWTLCDDGFSQNGTYVNGLRIHGRRRLIDGDLVRIGQTTMAYCDPGLSGLGVTLAPGELGHRAEVLRAAAADPARAVPAADGRRRGDQPARDAEIAAATGIAEEIVTTELDHLGRSFGLQDMPRPTSARRSRCSRSAPGWSRPTSNGPLSGPGGADPARRGLRGGTAGWRGVASGRIGAASASARGAAGLEPGDELVELELLEAAADGLELAGAELDEPPALLAELERLAQPGLAGVQAADDRLDARAGRLVGEGGSVTCGAARRRRRA